MAGWHTKNWAPRPGLCVLQKLCFGFRPWPSFFQGEAKKGEKNTFRLLKNQRQSKKKDEKVDPEICIILGPGPAQVVAEAKQLND